MHSDPTHEQVLSAFFDGEADDVERPLVERSRNDSAETRQTLDEFAQLRSLMQELVRPAAPTDLRSAILSQITTDTAPVQPVAAPRSILDKSAPRSRFTGKHWGAALAAAAAILVMTLVLPQRSSRLPVSEMASSSLDAREPLPAADDLHVASNAAALRADDEALPRVTAEATMVAAAPATLGATAINSDDWIRNEILARGRIPERGEVIEFLNREADRVLLVTISVIDVDVAPGQIRMLLSRNGIREVSTTGEPLADSVHDARAIETEGGRLAILVVTDPQNLAQLVEEIGMMELVDNCRIDEPLSESPLLAMTPRGASSSNLPAASAAAEQVPLADAEPLSVDRAARTGIPQLARARVNAAEKDLPDNGVQMDVTIPPDLLSTRFASRQLVSEDASASKLREYASQQQVREADPSTMAALSGSGLARNPMPVLFLIEGRSPGR